MAAEKLDEAFLWDMLEAAKSTSEFVAEKTVADYLANKLLRSAVERQIEIVGEAARQISAAFQKQHPEIPWKLIVAQRHVLAHDYGEIDHERIWRVAATHIPDLISLLDPLVPPAPT